MEYTIEDTFDVSAAVFWDVFFSEAFNAALWPVLNIDWQLLRFESAGEGPSRTIHREARLTPKREVPRMLRSLVDSSISYVEKNDFQAATSAMKTVVVPSFMADRIDNRGVFRLEILGPTQVKRVWEGQCTAKVPLLGKRVEEFLVEQIRESYEKTTAFMRKWFAEHPA